MSALVTGDIRQPVLYSGSSAAPQLVFPVYGEDQHIVSWIVRGQVTFTAGGSALYLGFNGDTTAGHYNTHYDGALLATPTTPAAGNGAATDKVYIIGADAIANGGDLWFKLEIQNPISGKQRRVGGWASTFNTGTGVVTNYDISGGFLQTTAITEIDILVVGTLTGNFNYTSLETIKNT
jgi:hypothetical protein